MAKTFREWSPGQRLLFPPSPLDFVPANHLAHFVRDTVSGELDLRAILDCYSEERGYPPYHPVMMVALLLYGYCQGVYSSRRIARCCAERVDFMAVTAMQTPDFRTISLFRQRHRDALRGLFVQVLRLCQTAGLVKLGHVALDGTKMRANASKHKAMSYGRMLKAEKELQDEVGRWLREADATDACEDDEHGDRRGDEMPDWVANKQQRLEKIREAKAALEAEAAQKSDGAGKRSTPDEKSQRNFTDPESRIMLGRDGWIQGYNSQIAVDGSSHVIVAQDVTSHPTDIYQLIPMVEQIKANTGRQARELSGDAGYCSEANLRELSRRHIRGYIATGRQTHGATTATGDRLGTRRNRVRAMRLRLQRAGHRSRYRLRKQIVEPVFGVIKQARGFRQYLTRGLENVAAEWALICTAHNLLKLAAARV